MFITSIRGEMRVVVQNWWLVILENCFIPYGLRFLCLGCWSVKWLKGIFISSSSRDTRKIAHSVSVAPFILKNAKALNKAHLRVSVLSGAFCRAVPSCGSIYRHGFGIYESFHQPLNHGSANTEIRYKIRQRYRFHIKAEWKVLPPELPLPISVVLKSSPTQVLTQPDGA